MTAAEPMDVVIVGAGFAGLGTAAALRRFGVRRFVVIERGWNVGAFWTGVYDRLHLHSPWHDLPEDGGLVRRYPMYKSRDEVLHYLDAYAHRFRLHARVRCGDTAMRIARAPAADGWIVETAQTAYHARYVVLATAMNREPTMPEVPDRPAFRGHVLHAARYRNALPFAGQRVLVVGSGNSAAEIALDLVDHGARAVDLWVRGPRHFLPRSRMTALFLVSRLLGMSSPRALDRFQRVAPGTPPFARVVRQRDRLAGRIGLDLSRYGIRRPAAGPFTEMLTRGRVPVFDRGTARAIGEERIGVVDGTARPLRGFTAHGVRLGDGETHYDAVLFATGFAPRLEPLLPDHARLLGPRPGGRAPRIDAQTRSTVEPTLFAPSFGVSLNGGAGLGRFGWAAGAQIAAELAAGSRLATPPLATPAARDRRQRAATARAGAAGRRSRAAGASPSQT
ncbi:MAG: NAD(P)/FAD-dependent oxidoreductase [bacterium]|nr:NAD(P)/FAD-dependent oxidoreductase [bacterium]